MEYILGNLYELLDSFYGYALRDYLWGFDCDTSDFTAPILFNHAGVITIIISLIVVVLYYYVLDHPKLANWRGWFLFMLINLLVTAIFGYFYVKMDLDANLICTAFINTESTGVFAVDNSSCFGFAMANGLVSILFYIVWSLSLKWFSKSSKHVPF